MNMKFRTTTAALIVAALSATAATPVMAQSRSISQAERAQGQKAHPQLLEEFGGVYTGPQAAYVTRVGQTIALQSGLSNARSDFTVSLLNSPVNNAFAVPGGYVYVTRQLTALMNNEAELAGVLGHEIGHVAAQHARKRQSNAQRNSILGVLGSVLGGLIGGGGGIAGALGGLLQSNAMQVAQLATLGFSRSQETEADQLGIRYLRGAGYDTNALSTMLVSLAAQDNLEARVSGRDARSIPEWASTHPDPASRVRAAQTYAQRTGGVRARTGEVEFKSAIDGVLYGDDPRQGIVEGQNFLHPDLKLAFTVPRGFGMQNGTRAVSVSGSGGQALFSTVGNSNGNLPDYISRAFRQVAGQTQIQIGRVQTTRVNGLPAAYASARSNTQQGAVDLTIFAYDFPGSTDYHFATITQAGRTSIFNSMFQSVRPLTTAQAAAIKPRYIDVVTVGRGDTIQSLANRMGYDQFREERFRVLNRLDSNTALTPGQRVKIIVRGNR